MKNVCYIVGSGDFDKKSFNPAPDDLVISADGGLKYTNGRENLIIGDFDSAEKPDGDNVVQLPCEKNDTDVGYAIDYALKLGYNDFKLHGVLGGNRLSHTIGNIQLLLMLRSKGANGELYGKNTVCYLIEKDKTYPQSKSGFISFFALQNSIVTLTNFKYPLNNYSLSPDFPLGISNEFFKFPAHVSINEGLLLAVEECYD